MNRTVFLKGLLVVGACASAGCVETAEVEVATGNQIGVNVTSGGVALASTTPGPVLTEVRRLHTERSRALPSLLRFGTEAAPAMAALLTSQSREEVLGALSWYRVHGHRGPTSTLVALTRHPHPGVRRESATVLRISDIRAEAPSLMPLLEDPDEGVRLSAIEGLRRFRHRPACDLLMARIRDGSEQVALLAGRAVTDLCGEGATARLLKLLTRGEGLHARLSALWALRRRNARVPMAYLGEALQSSDIRVAQEAVKGFALHGVEGMERLVESSGDSRPEVRQLALAVLTRYFPAKALPLAEHALADVSGGVRAEALDALSRLQARPQAASVLARHVTDPDPTVRGTAVARLGLLGSVEGARVLASRWRVEPDGDVGRLLVEALGQSRTRVAAAALVDMLTAGEDPWAFRARHALSCMAGSDQGSAAEWRAWMTSDAAAAIFRPGSAAE